jgi:hypothetical protein
VSEVRWGGESSASGTRGVYDQSHVPVERIAWTGSGNSRISGTGIQTGTMGLLQI